MDFRRGCFIASAVYGSPAAPEVEALHNVLDHRLMRSAPRRAFIQLSYRVSPPAAATLAQNPRLATHVRHALDQLIDWMFMEKHSSRHRQLNGSARGDAADQDPRTPVVAVMGRYPAAGSWLISS